MGTADAAKTVLSIADEALCLLDSEYEGQLDMGRGGIKEISQAIPFDEILGLGTELLVRREVQVPWPLHNLPVRVVRLLGAEWWPADQTLEHDGSN